MPLPVILVVEPPTRAELRALASSPRAWLCAFLTFAACVVGDVGWLRFQAGQHQERPGGAPVALTSLPAGASTWIDGQARGQTPLSLGLPPGTHTLLVRQPGYVDVQTRLDVPPAGTSFETRLWPQQASASRLRPTFPGATIADAGFLGDGRVVLTVALPSTDERQAWLFDPTSNAWQRVGPTSSPVRAIAVAPSGRRVAYLVAGRATTSPTSSLVGSGGRVDELWMGDAPDQAERRYVLPTSATDQHLGQVAWSPDATHLLLTAQQQVAGGAERTRVLWLDADRGDPRELVVLPSAVVPGSVSWSPTSDRVAFLARPTTTAALALCLLDSQGGFRYLTDLGSADTSTGPGFPPLAWSPDGGRLLYTAPARERAVATSGLGLWPFGGSSKPSAALFLADPDNPAGARLGDATDVVAPAWREDGSLVTIGRPGKDGGRLELRGVDAASGHATTLSALPVQTGAAFATRWDVPHAQVLVATRSASASLAGTPASEYWLIRFGEPGSLR